MQSGSRQYFHLVLAGFVDILIAREGAFGTHLLEHDVTDAPIMFGKGGMLDASQLPAGTGFGLAPAG